MLRLTESKLITIVYSANLGTSIDLCDLFKKITINESIISVKYNGEAKGPVKSLKCLYNQVSILVFSDIHDKYTNVKVFSNGKIHISGIQNKDQAISAIRVILNILISIKEKEQIDVIVVNGIIYDKKDYDKHGLTDLKSRENIVKIYSFDPITKISKKIGFKKGKLFVIHGETCILIEDHFVSSKFINSVKNIYNKNGDTTHSYEYIHKFNRKNNIMAGRYFSLNEDYNFDILDKYYSITGTISVVKNEDNERLPEIDPDLPSITFETECISDKFLSNYSDIDEIMDTIKLNVVNYSKKTLILNENNQTVINKQKLHEIFRDQYPANSKENEWKTDTYLDINDRRLIVKISNGDYHATCVFFSTGTMLLSSKNSSDSKVKDFITKILNENDISENIKAINTLEINDKLTIFDLF